MHSPLKHSPQKKSRTGEYLSRFAETQWKSRVPALAKNAAWVTVAGLASLFALIWLSYTFFSLFNESFGWSRPLAAFATAVIFGLVGAGFLGALKKHQAKEREKRAIEKELAEAQIPALSPMHGLQTAMRSDVADVVRERTQAIGVAAREKGEVAMEWVAEHPVRAAAIGAAAGWLAGTWTRQATAPIETH